jgi:hypothetical protein
MSEKAEDRDQPEADEPEGGTSRGDVEAPRAEFKGRTPE